MSLRVHTYLGLEARRVASRTGHRTVAVSGLIAEQLRKAYGAGLSCPIIPPGVARPPKVDGSQKEQVRQQIGWGGDDFVCLLVARNPLRKGLPTVLKALAHLPGRYKLLVVGGNASIRDYINKSGEFRSLLNRIHLVEATPDVSPYYRAADIYVHPTLNDSFGMAPLEAMSFDLPVILSPSPWCGFAQYVRDGQDAAILSHPEDYEQLAQFVTQISGDAAWRARLVQGGNEVVDQHSWPRVASQYQALYSEVIAERADFGT